MNKNLLICPNCESKGLKQVLGEVNKDGSISVLRFKDNSTEVKAKEYVVICGACGEKVFVKRR